MAILAQGIGLAWQAGADGRTSAGVSPLAITVSLVLGCAFVAWRRRWRHTYLETILVTTNLGGLGMLLGMWVDATTNHGASMAGNHGASMAANHGMAVHAHGADAGAMLLSWSTVLMLLFCFVGCHWLCDEPCPTPNRRFRFLTHLVICGPMLIGMWLGGAGLAAGLGHLIGSPTLGSHLAMVLGMAAGTALGLGIVRIAWTIYNSQGWAPFPTGATHRAPVGSERG